MKSTSEKPEIEEQKATEKEDNAWKDSKYIALENLLQQCYSQTHTTKVNNSYKHTKKNQNKTHTHTHTHNKNKTKNKNKRKIF